MNRILVSLLVLVSLARSAAALTPPPGVHYLYLVRHGMYDRDEHADDRTGNGLNALGHEQAKLLAARLAGLPVHLHALVSSDLRRARETADDLATTLKLTPSLDPLLRECTPTPKRPTEASTRCDQQLAEAWAKYATPTAAEDTHDLLVAHGNVIRWLTLRAIGGDLHRWTSLDLANASLTIIAITADGQAFLIQYGDASHIPIVKQTYIGPSPGWLRVKGPK